MFWNTFESTPVLAAGALPSGGHFVAGQGAINSATNGLVVNQTSSHAIVNWQNFSIGQGNTVQFNNGTGATLNRVTGGNLSQIDGLLKGTGSVYLINPQGIVIGAGGKVVTGGSFVGSTRDVSNSQFLSGGALSFSGTSNGNVTNGGTITSANGDVVLVGRSVTNTGTIKAANGTAGLAAGDQVVLQPVNGDQRIAVSAGSGSVTNSGDVSAAAAELKAAGGNVYALAGNSGVVRATGTATINGHVWLTANGDVGVKGAVAATNADGSGGAVTVRGNNISVSGQVAASATAPGKTGGTVSVIATNTTQLSGTIKAEGGRGGHGGSVETSGAHVHVADSAHVSTLAPGGVTGTWLIDPADYTIAASGGDMTGAVLSSALESNDITLASSDGTVNANGNGDIFVNDAVSWSSASHLTLNAARNIEVNAGISLANGTLNLNAAGNIFVNAGISLTGGALNLNAAYAIDVNSTIHVTGAGAVNLSANSFVAYGGTDSYGDNSSSFLPNILNLNFADGASIDFGAVNNGATLSINNTPYRLLYSYDDMFSNLSANYISAIGATGAFALATDIHGGTYEDSNFSLAPGGIFEGLGHVMDSATLNYGTSDHYFGFNDGLFNTNQGTIRDFAITNATVNGAASGGGGGILLGTLFGGLIANVHVTGIITSNDPVVGGLVGDIELEGEIYNAWTDVPMTRSSMAPSPYGVAAAGGLVGEVYTYPGPYGAVFIVNSHALGAVTGYGDVGGLVGANGGVPGDPINLAANSLGYAPLNYSPGEPNVGAALINDYAAGNVTYAGTGSAGDTRYASSNVGGLAGVSSTFLPITNSYATGNVGGGYNAGGLVGYLFEGGITNSHATGNVSGGFNSGGLVGSFAGSPEAIIAASYATGNVTGNGASGSGAGGLVGRALPVLGDYGYGDSSGQSLIEQSYALGSVSNADYAGGLVGYMTTGSVDTGNGFLAVIEGYAAGSVTGATAAGGLIGYYAAQPNLLYGASFPGLIVAQSLSIGAVRGSGSVGGAIGAVNITSELGSYWVQAVFDSDTAGTANGIGAISVANPSSVFANTVTGLHTAVLQNGTLPDILGTPLSYDCLSIPCGAADWAAQSGAFPYLTTFFPNGVQAISGMAYSDGGATPLAAGTVSALADGKSLGQVSTGANGYYYFAAQPGAFASGSALLVSTANGARVDALTSGANVTGFDIWGNTLIAPTSLTTYSAAVGEDHSALLNAADGNNSQLTGAINSLASRGFVAGGDFAVNGSPGLSNGLYVKSAGSITVSDPLTLTGNNLMLDAAQALDINAPITVTGSAINLTAGSSVEVNAGISLTGGALNLTAASAIDVNKTITVTGAGAVNLMAGYYGPSILNLNFADGASLDFGSTNYGATLTISNRPYTLLYSFDDMYANFSGSYVLSIFGASGAFAMATDIDGGTYYNSNFGLASGGIFEGLGHVMDHVTLDYGDYGPSSNYSGNTTGFLYNDGLFNSTSGTIRDFAITNATFNGDPNIIGLGYPNYGSAGILAGFMEGGLIANVHVTGTITSNDVIVGGLVGLIEYQANIYNAWTDVPITRASMSANDTPNYSALAAGGLVGAVGGYAELNDVHIVNSHALGAVTGYGDVGGLVGANGTGFHDPISYATSDGSDLGGATLANDYATGNVTYAGSVGDARYASSNVGGLAGVSSYVPGYGIANSYATGNVGGGYNAGGLFGFMYDSSISGSHATGNVSGGFNAGGLVGSTYGAGYVYEGQADTVTNSYATGNVTGNGASGSSAGGLVGALVREEHGGDPYSFIALSYALGSVSNADYAGGLIGSLVGGGTFNLEGGFAAGSVTGATAAGGLIGYYSDLIPSIYDTFYVSKSLSIGAVRGSGSVGGAIGAVNETNPSDVYGVQVVFDSDTAGTANGIGATSIAGYNQANTVTPLHTTDLQNGMLPGLLGTAQVGCDVTCWTAQSGAYPYLTALFPNGVQAISGMASGSSVGLSIGGTSQGQASTGANGYYYFALPAGTLSGPGSLSLLTDTSGALLTRLSGQTAGLDIAPDALTYTTASTSYAASYGADRAAMLGWADTPAYVSGLDTTLTATGASFALDQAATLSGGLTVKTTGTTPVTVTAPVSAASVKIVSGGAITLDSTIAASGSGDAVVLDAGTGFVNNTGADAIDLTGDGRWLIYSGAPGSDTFGGLDSANTAVWNNSGTAVTQTGNRYVFASQPTVTVSAGPVSKTYGDTYTFTSADLSLSGLEAGVAGAYLGDTAASVFASLPTLSSTGAAATANVNTYDITLSGGAVTGGYALVLGSPGTLTVGQRALTITGDPLSRLYGDANPATWTASGDNLVNGDTIASVDLVSGTATAASNVGSYGYSIDNAAFSHGSASNYAITYADGSLTINARPITVTADGLTKLYGDANPALSFTTTSLGAGAAVLGSLATVAGDTTGVGSYAITAGGVTDTNNPNYTITYAGADLTITARPITLTYTADAAQIVYGDIPSGLSGTVALTSGSFAGSQGLADVVSGAAGFATAADGTSNVGHYAITGSGLAAFNTNYTVTLDQAAGNATALSITARPITLTYTAAAAQSVYGNMPTGLSGTVALTSGSYAGSQNLADVVSGAAGFATTADGTSNVGRYAITGSGLTAFNTNYTVTLDQAAGNATALSITARPITLTYTADAAQSVYGDMPTGLSGTVALTSGSFAGSQGLADVVSGAAGFATAADGTSNVGHYAINGSGLAAFNTNYAVTLDQAAGNATALSITARPITLTYTADAAQSVYGDMPSGLSGTVALTSGSYAGSQSLTDVVSGAAGFATTADGTSNVGRYAITGSGLAAFNTNYAVTLDQAAGNATALSITARPITVSYTADAAQSVYGDTPSGLTGSYALTSGSFAGSQNLADVVSGAAGFATTADGTSNVGHYAINGSGLAAFNTNYAVTLDQAAGNATALSITARPITLTYTADAAQSVYGDMPSGLSGTVALTSGSYAGSQSLTDVVSGAAGFATTADGTSNVGRYAITGSGLAAFNTNYAVTLDQAAGNATALSITARPITVTADSGQSMVYGDTVPALTYTVGGLVNDDSLSGALVTSATSTSNVGSYDITQGSLTASTNYTITSYTGANLAVTARPITVTADSGQSMVYGDTVPALTYTVGGLVNGDTLSGALATSATSTSNVGSYGIAQGSLASGNYTITSYTGADLAVTARPITVTYSADAASSVYGDVIGSLTGSSAITGGSLVNGDSLGGAAGFATLADGTSAVGTYGITGSGLTASGNYSLTSAQAAGNSTALQITARPITVTANALSRSYGAANPALTFTTTSLGAGAAVLGSLGTAAGDTTDVGTYAITQGGVTDANNPNYTITYAGADLTITARPITVTADALTKAYGDANPVLTFRTSDLGAGAALQGSLETVAGNTTGVGAYAITRGDVTNANNPNYDITYVGNDLTIGARAITVTANTLTRTYGDANPALTFTTSDLGFGEAVTGSLATSAGNTSGVGSYGIAQGSVTNANNPNYTITYVGNDLTIGARAITVTADALTRIYGDANPALTFTTSDLGFGDAVTGSLATSAGNTSGVGSYSIAQGSVTSLNNPNYTISYIGNDLTIAPRAITVTADALTRTYGDATPALTFTTSDLGFGAAVQGLLATSADNTSNVGSYGITQGSVTSLNNPNYTISYIGNSLAITPRAITVTADALTRTYGDANPTLSFTTSSLGYGAAVQGSLDTSADNTSGIGSYAIAQGTVTNANNRNYDITYAGSELTITARPITITADDRTKIYGDGNPALTETVGGMGLVNGDTLAGSLATSVDGATGVGAYAITQGTLAASSNYTVVGFTPGTLSVTARPITITADDKSRTYGDANPTLTETIGGMGLVNGDTLTGSLATTADNTSGVGDYAITQGSQRASANYDVTFVDGLLSIGQRALTITGDPLTRLYGDANPSTWTATGDDLVNGDTISSVDLVSSTATATSNVGNGYSYSMDNAAFSHGSASNYAITYVDGGLTINARPITVTANTQTKTYGDTNPALTFTTTSLGAGAAVLGSLGTAAGNSSDVGSYGITQGSVTSANNANYTISYIGNDLAITPRAITVTADALTRAYGDANPVLTFRTSDLGAGVAVQGSLDTAAGSSSDVGSYGITQGSITNANNSNYAISYIGNDLAITPRAITVTANSQTKTYGDTNPALTFTTSDLGAGAAVLGALDTAAGNSSDVGSYRITQGSVTNANNGNYDITYVGANLDINIRPIIVTADALTKTYGDANPVLTFTTSGLGYGAAVQGSLDTTADHTTGVGAYGITQGSVTNANNNNYAITYVGNDLTITARPITVTADALTRSYGDANPALTFTTSDLGAGVAVQGSLDTAAGNSTGVGAYAITQGDVTNANNPNYIISYVGSDLTIAPRPVTVTADALTRIYGDANPALAYTVSNGNLVNGDLFSGALGTAADATSNVGFYAITQGTLAASPNYTLTYVPGTLAVTARPLTVTAEDASRVYGGANPAFTYTIGGDGLVNGDTLSGALATVADSHADVGRYAITQGTLAASANYALAYVPGTLAITPAALTIQADDISAPTLATARATATYLGRVAGDDSSVVMGLQFGFFPITGDPRDYDIVPFGASAQNYDISYLPGLLTLAAQPPSVFTAPIILKGGLGALPMVVVTTGDAAFTFSDVATAAIDDSTDMVLFGTALPGRIGDFSQIMIPDYSNATDDGDRLVTQ